METKELKIQVPEGYEIDKENSTFECIKFKQIKKNITYKDICNNILKTCYYINSKGKIICILDSSDNLKIDKNNATNKKQLERLLALNQLLNIAEYYNRLYPIDSNVYTIIYGNINTEYKVCCYDEDVVHSVIVTFNRKEDAQAVINNPNFREILDTIYKD